MPLSTQKKMLLALCFLSILNCIGTVGSSPSTSYTVSHKGHDVGKTSPVPSAQGGSTQTFNINQSPGKLARMKGINFAGLEFGMNDGKLTGGGNVPPPITQLSHFIKEDGINLIRIPFGWQYLQPEIKGPLSSTQLALLDKYVEETLKLNACAIISLQNFARREGKIVGQSDIGADALADVWSKLATHYKSKPRVIFGLMNEPHDVIIKTWIGVVQQVVTAIRKTGAQNHILLPGNGYSHLSTFSADYNAGMSLVKNPDGTNNGLIFEVHQYFDADGSGTLKGCSLDHINELNSVAALLKKDGRQVLISEIGGDSSKSCVDILTRFVKAIDQNYPAVAGWAIWAAGSFASDVPLMITHQTGTTFTDQPNFNAVKSSRSKKFLSF